MIIKALLAAIGLRAAPSIHNPAVHAMRSDDASAIGGFRIIARQTARLSADLLSAPDDTEKTDKRAAALRQTLAAVAERTDRRRS